MPLCYNKYKNIVREQNEIIKEQKETILKLENELKSLKEACKHNSQFKEYFKFYLNDRKKYNTIIKEVDRILKKFNF